MGTTLQDLIDHHDIVRVLGEYCHGCDRGDAALMGSVYAQDSWDDHGSMQGPGGEFARAMMSRILVETETLAHHLGQSLIRVEGDLAAAETYFIAVQRRADSHGAPLCEQLGGRYVDRLERANAGWKIVHRTTVRDWSISLPVEEDHFLQSKLTAGSRNATDVGVSLLGLAHGACSPLANLQS